jgi:hypothetical protein
MDEYSSSFLLSRDAVLLSSQFVKGFFGKMRGIYYFAFMFYDIE